METLATIVIAARNAASTIERAVRSAILQKNCPIILVDDFSSDDTVDRAKEAGGRRLTVVRPPEHRSLGLTRQTAVLAFQFGDGLSNMLIPTSGVLMAMLALGGVPYATWLRFVLPLFLQLIVLAAMFLIVAVLVAY